jgi:hypothetical protein
MSGMASQYFTNLGLGYHGVTGGPAAGLGVSGGGIVTYTRFAGTYSLLGGAVRIAAIVNGEYR